MSIARNPHVATNLAFFLLEKTGSVCGVWAGNMPADEQRALFGRFLGKGRVHIDGSEETLRHTRKVCFGLDYEETYRATWADITFGRDSFFGHIPLKAI
jgi:hypothetical protein